MLGNWKMQRNNFSTGEQKGKKSSFSVPLKNYSFRIFSLSSFSLMLHYPLELRYNRSINLIKSNALYTHTSLEEINETQIIESYLSQHLRNQEHSLLLKELEEEIATYVETLPPQCRRIFLLSRTYGMKNKEIADQLGISIKAVEKQITKAIFGLKEYLEKKDLLFLCWFFSTYF